MVLETPLDAPLLGIAAEAAPRELPNRTTVVANQGLQQPLQLSVLIQTMNHKHHVDVTKVVEANAPSPPAGITMSCNSAGITLMPGLEVHATAQVLGPQTVCGTMMKITDLYPVAPHRDLKLTEAEAALV